MKLPRRSFASRSSMRGFSLIEMVAAFLVFAIAIGVLMSVLTAAMRNTRMSADYTMAALWAQTKLDVVGVGIPVEEGHSSGRFDDTYNWDLDIHKVDASAVEPPPQSARATRSRWRRRRTRRATQRRRPRRRWRMARAARATRRSICTNAISSCRGAAATAAIRARRISRPCARSIPSSRTAA
jgi:Tfp pilus assembly protein PilV